MANFALDLRTLLDKYQARAEDVAAKTVLAVGTSVVLKSPVGDGSLWKRPPPPGYVGGRFRANWQHGFNVQPSGDIDGVDPTGANTIENIKNKVSSVDAGGIHYLINNLPYAEALEYGHSSQAPSGMVGITVVEFEDYVKAAVAEVTK